MRSVSHLLTRTSFLVTLIALFALPASAAANGGITPKLVTGGSHTCALADTGVVSCWGANEKGQLGTGDVNPRPSPAPVVGLEGGVSSIGATENGTCAIKQDSTVWCWGANDFAQLGQGTQDGDPHATPVAIANIKDVYWLIGGANHVCAISWNNAMHCWGSNADGQAGTGAAGGVVAAPAQVVGVTKVKAAAAGANFTCISGETAKVRCWGVNDKGQLGSAPGGPTGTPTAVPGVEGVYDLQAGDAHVCARTWSKSALVCWGDNFYGQLAQATTGETAPRGASAVTTLGEPMQLGGTSGSTCSVAKSVTPSEPIQKSGGNTTGPLTLYCWGEGTGGRLGVGNETHSGSPLAVALGDVAALSQGSTSRTHCAIVRGGGVFCWGDNALGQAGLGAGAPAVLIPTVVPGLDLVTRAQYPAWASMEPRSRLKKSKSGNARIIKSRLKVEPSPFVFATEACSGNVVANAYYVKKVRKRKQKAKKSNTLSTSPGDGFEYKKIGVRTGKTKLRRSGGYCMASFKQVLPDSKFEGKRPIYLSATFFGNKAMTKFTGGDYELLKKKKRKKK